MPRNHVKRTNDLFAPIFKPRDYWTFERCQDEAAKYPNRAQFFRGSQQAYQKAREKGWLDDIIAPGRDPKAKRPDETHWTYERCLSVAKTCRNAREWRKTDAYKGACRHKLHLKIDDECGFKKRVPKNHWTEERCAVEVKKYQNRTELLEHNYGLYQAINRNKWHHLFDHMDLGGNHFKRFVYEIADHSRKVIYIGITFSIKERQTSHRRVSDHLKKHFPTINLYQVSTLLPPQKSAALEVEFIRWYREKGYTVLNRNRGGVLGGHRSNSNMGIAKLGAKFGQKTKGK